MSQALQQSFPTWCVCPISGTWQNFGGAWTGHAPLAKTIRQFTKGASGFYKCLGGAWPKQVGNH